MVVVQLIKVCGGRRREAFNIVTGGWAVGGGLLLALAWTVAADEAAVQARMRAALHRAHGDPQQVQVPPSRTRPMLPDPVCLFSILPPGVPSCADGPRPGAVRPPVR